MKTKTDEKKETKMSRKEALKKVGRYAAFTAAGSILILKAKAGAGGSTSPRQRGFGY